MTVTVAHWFEKRQEREELLLRFFALSDLFPKYDDSVGIARQLDKYFEKKNTDFSVDESQKKINDLEIVMNFIEKTCEYGFAKNHTNQISRVYFEALSIGTLFALRERPDLMISKQQMLKILNAREFKEIIGGKYHTHKTNKILSRINYIKKCLVNSR